MDGRPVNLQDPVSDMNGVFHIRTNAIGINPGGGKRQSGENSSSSEKKKHLSACTPYSVWTWCWDPIRPLFISIWIETFSDFLFSIILHFYPSLLLWHPGQRETCADLTFTDADGAKRRTHWETLTVWPLSGLKPPVGLSGWSMATEKPRPLRPLLPSASAGMDTSVTVWGIREHGESGSETGVTMVW